MKIMLKEELHQALHGISFWVALVLGLLLTGSHYIREVLMIFPTTQQVAAAISAGFLPSVFNVWIGANFTTLEAYLFFLLLPVLAALPFAGSFCEELQSGFLQVKLLSCKHKRDYFIAKSLTVFLTGGIVILVPLLANLLCTAATVPAFIPIASSARFSIFPTSMWAELFYSHPWVYTVAYLLIIFIYSGLFAQLALIVSYYLSNKILVILSPMLIYIFLYGICSTLSIGQFAPFCFLPPNQPVFRVSFGIITIEALMMAAAVCIGYIKKGVQKDVM